jgi:hypothetical protein
MTDPQDFVLREVAELRDPVLSAARAQQIQRLARTVRPGSAGRGGMNHAIGS